MKCEQSYQIIFICYFFIRFDWTQRSAVKKFHAYVAVHFKIKFRMGFLQLDRNKSSKNQNHFCGILRKSRFRYDLFSSMSSIENVYIRNGTCGFDHGSKKFVKEAC